MGTGKVRGPSTQLWAGKFGGASQTSATAFRNARSLIRNIYFYCHLQSYSWYFTFIWECLCSLQTFTHPIRGKSFHAHFPDSECDEINVAVKCFPSRFPSLSPDLTLITQPGLPGEQLSNIIVRDLLFLWAFTFFPVIGWCFSSPFCQFQVSTPTPNASLLSYCC